MFPRPDFFSGARLNFAENLLFPANCSVDPSSTAIIAATESTREHVSWAELRERVRQCANAMRELGVQESDRVAGFLGNHTNTVVAMLAATSIGAIWTGVSPDTGVHAVLDRLVQIEPVMLFADNAVTYNGKVHDGYEKNKDIIKELKGLKAAVIFETVPGHDVVLTGLEVAKGKAMTYQDFLSM
jgi:acetoacetyl-CoA synthetase